MAERACRECGLDLEGATVAVQGFGNVGSWAAKLLGDLGATIVAVSDSRGGVFRGDGLDVEALITAHHTGARVSGTEGVDHLTNDELLGLEVDILVPAALGDVLNGRTAGAVRAKLVVEGANAPTTPDADALLQDRGVVVVPDILANAGGVTVSYFEWVQNVQQFRWSAERVDQELTRLMGSAYDAVAATAIEHQTSIRTAAFMVAIRRVARAMELRGV